MKKSVMDIETRHRCVLVRADFNVPLNGDVVADDSRIRAALPTLRHLQQQEACVIICSHLGRPGGKVVEKLRLDPVAARLADLMSTDIIKADDCIGADAVTAVNALMPGEILLLENTRFHAEETANDPEFAARLADFADLFVNDAFAAAHRAHASTQGVADYLPSVAGVLMQREINVLTEISRFPTRPAALILGGAKIGDKIQVIEALNERFDRIIIGGAMANTFLKAGGIDMGRSLIDEQSLSTARRLMEICGDKLFLPEDVVAAESDRSDAQHRPVPVNEIPSQWKAVDIGPGTIEIIMRLLPGMRTVVWNGTMGMAELPPFARGTQLTARILAELDTLSVVGGGDTVAALQTFGLADRMTHVSTGGGAFLEFLAGRELPGIAALQDA